MSDDNSKKWKGMLAGAIAFVLALAATITLQPTQPNMLIPAVVAIIAALVGLTIALSNKNPTGIGLNIVAMVLSFWAVWAWWTSPEVQNAYHKYSERAQERK